MSSAKWRQYFQCVNCRKGSVVRVIPWSFTLVCVIQDPAWTLKNTNAQTNHFGIGVWESNDISFCLECYHLSLSDGTNPLLKQILLTISEIVWYTPESNFTASTPATALQNDFEVILLSYCYISLGPKSLKRLLLQDDNKLSKSNLFRPSCHDGFTSLYLNTLQTCVHSWKERWPKIQHSVEVGIAISMVEYLLRFVRNLCRQRICNEQIGFVDVTKPYIKV